MPLPPIGSEVTDAPGLPPIGGEVSSTAPTFRSSNETDASGRATVRDDDSGWMDQLADFVKSSVGGIANVPIGIAKAGMAANTSLARGIQYGLAGQPMEGVKSIASDADSMVRGIGDAAGSLRSDAEEAFKRGDYQTGSRKLVNYILTGIGIGPGLDAASDKMEQGQYGEALGEATALGVSLGAPVAATRVGKIRVPSPYKNVNPAEQAAVEFGASKGIPIDAATATGNRFVRGTQNRVDRSFLGSHVAERAAQEQGAAFERVGRDLATRAHPAAVTTEQAGAGVRAGVTAAIDKQRARADKAYGAIREAEANPLTMEDVPAPIPKAIRARMHEQVGTVTADELQALRRIREELDAVPFQKGRLSRDKGAGFDSGDTTYSARAAGAPVYDDIMQYAPGTSKMTRGEVLKSIDDALKTGTFTNGARGALEVAKKRVASAGKETYAGLTSPILPPDAGAVMQPMAMPVNIGAAKTALGPVHAELVRQKDVAGALHGTKARALLALDSLMGADDYVPLTVVDGVLSDLKSLARVKDGALRNAGQGAAAQAVKHLDEQVRTAAAKAGPDVLQALEKGRKATQAKYFAADVLKQLGKTDMSAARRVRASNDLNIGLVRELAKLAPEELPKVGRAFLDDLLTTATAEGGLHRAGTIQNKWMALGAETKKLLYKDAGLVQDLDRFFLLAKKAAENPNPSGTAWTMVQAGEMGAWALSPAYGAAFSVSAGAMSKLLHSPKAVRLLNQGMTAKVSNTAASRTMLAELTAAAREAGVQLAPAADGAGRE